MFSRKWEFIFMQAEAQAKVAKKRDKQERKILDSQERAFWDVYRPPPGQVNTTEMDIKKMYKLNQIFGQEQTPVLESCHLNRQLAALQVTPHHSVIFSCGSNSRYSRPWPLSQ